MTKESNLHSALEKFIKEIRNFISSEMENKFGDNWVETYKTGLWTQQQREWESHEKSGKEPKDLIDYGNLRNFALNQRDFLIQARLFLQHKSDQVSISDITLVFSSNATQRSNTFYHLSVP